MVAIRVRPLKEAESGPAWTLKEDGSVFLRSATEHVPGQNAFRYNACFDEDKDTAAVYDGVARSLVEGVLHGISGTVFAYGQTSSAYRRACHII